MWFLVLIIESVLALVLVLIVILIKNSTLTYRITLISQRSTHSRNSSKHSSWVPLN